MWNRGLFLPGMIVSAIALATIGCGPGVAPRDTGGGGAPQVDADGDGAYSDADCDDVDPLVFPGAAERCNELDDNCDGVVDEAAPGTAAWYVDSDADGYGDNAATGIACAAPAGTSPLGGDCDDADPDDHPDATEVVGNGDDDDCDGAERCFADADDDGYLPDAPEMALSADADCEDPFEALFSDPGGDCDDGDPAVSPAGIEVCDDAEIDEDCNTYADDDDPGVVGTSLFYADADFDGYGDAARAILQCHPPPTFVENAEDCDDDDAESFPGADEQVGTQIDEDCDGGEVCFLDADADGFVPSDWLTVVSTDSDCVDSTEASLGARFEDCDDGDAAVSPDGLESCNLVDDDCDTSIDEGVESTWYADTDGDGYGNVDSTTLACTAPAGYVADAQDCVDTVASVHPGAAEVCADGYDNDCDAERSDCAFEGTYAATSAEVAVTAVGEGDSFGESVVVGDFDGDGAADLIVGTPTIGTTGDTGEAALFYGPITTSLSSRDADAWLAASSGYMAGEDVAVGDLDGDGADDLVVGTPGASSDAGSVYIVFGGTRRTESMSGYIGTIYTGVNGGDRLGTSLASGGDLDGDGTDELLMGASGQDGGGNSSGSAYLVYGASARSRGVPPVSRSDATIEGVTNALLGHSTAFVPDIDGDGLDELAVGAVFATGAAVYSGSAYLYLGDSVELVGTMSAPSTCSLIMPGLVSFDFAGAAVGGVGDLDGDGYADVGSGSLAHDEGAVSDVGKLAIYPGGTVLSATPFATVVGIASGDTLGASFTSPGDLDGDGADDVVVGAPGVDTAYTGAGAAYLLYGPVGGTTSVSAAGAVFLGAATSDTDFGERMARGAHDLTGDGATDLVFGAPMDDTVGEDAGAVYIWAGLGGP